ncbi:MAG: acyl carrier protein [Pasteurella sp.]|nr:acyl carrier protein [Pasteurella sp.]
MTEQQIQTLLTEALEELFEIDPAEVTLESNLYEDLDIDSIDAIDFIDYIKINTGHKLQADDFRSVRTVSDVIQAIIKIQNAQ